MTILLNILLVVFSCALIAKGADWLVDSAAKIANRFGISELVIGLTVVALGTSAPEFAVTLGSAYQGYEDISVANVVGSNIFNLGFILGGCAVVRAIKTTPTLVWRDGGVLVATTMFLVFCLYDGYLARWEGAVLFAGLITYISVLFIKRQGSDEDLPTDPATPRDVLLLLMSFVFVVGGSQLLVLGARGAATEMGISDWLIGVTIVAAGTSVPEFATALIALLKGHHGISAGALVGSDIFNLLGVLGIAGMLHPLTVTDAAFSSVVMLMMMVLLVVVLMRTGWQISRWQGALLVMLNFGRWALDFRAAG